MNIPASRQPDDAMRHRAGRRIAQPTGYRAYPLSGRPFRAEQFVLDRIGGPAA